MAKNKKKNSAQQLGGKFLEIISGKRRLKQIFREEGEVSFWSGIAMLGLIGWMIIIPTLLGTFLGRFLDRKFGQGLFWTLTLMMLGLALGCYNAWQALKERGCK